MKPFIPNDKFDVSSLYACWDYVQQNPSEFDEAYLSELAAKTFQLFYHYCQDDNLPKEIIRLIPVMTLYQTIGNHPAFSSEDICKTIAKELIDQLIKGFKKIKNPSTDRISPAGEWFAVCYQGEVYQIETRNFDFAPIKNRNAVKYRFMQEDVMLEKRRKQLYEIYKVWETELRSICPQIIAEGYSYPYYLHIPDNWFDSNLRIMIVGEEGAGEKRYDETIETAQQFNKDYLQSQLNNGDENYSKNCSQFWHRFRKIASLPGVSVVWNNLDKIHISRKRNGKLKVKDRKALHQTPTKILQEEIRLLEPTHVIFFGWYGISLQNECPNVFDKLYPGGPKDCSVWQSEKMASLSVDGIHYIFTYHPGWRNKGKDYEDKVMQLIHASL